MNGKYHMVKKLAVLMLAAVMLICCVPAGWAEAAKENTFEWEVDTERIFDWRARAIEHTPSFVYEQPTSTNENVATATIRLIPYTEKFSYDGMDVSVEYERLEVVFKTHSVGSTDIRFKSSFADGSDPIEWIYHITVTKPLLPPEITVTLNTDVVKLDHGNYGISGGADLALIGINHAVMKVFKAPDNVALAADVAIWGINQYLSSIPRETFEPDPVAAMVHIKDLNEHKPGDGRNSKVAVRLHFDFPRMSLKGNDQYNEYLGKVMRPFWADYIFTYKPEYSYSKQDYSTQLTWWAEWGKNKEPFTPLGIIEGGTLPVTVESYLEAKSVYELGAKKAREIEQKRMISAHCPVNLLVLDADGNVLATIESDDTERFEQDGVIAYADGEAKHVIIPADKLGQYTVKLEGTDEGSMTLVASDMLHDGTVAVHAYADIPLAKGSAYAAGTEETISFAGEDGAALTPDVVVNKDTVMESLAQTDAVNAERVSTAILRGLVPAELCENFSQQATLAEFGAVLDRLTLRFGLPFMLENEDEVLIVREDIPYLLADWFVFEELPFDAEAFLVETSEIITREDCILTALAIWDAIVAQ